MKKSELRVVTAATTEPVSIREAKLQLRVDHNLEDDRIAALIRAAKIFVEEQTRRQLVSTTYRWKLDEFPDGIEPIILPITPVSAVNSIKYLDSNGTEQTLSSSLYRVDVSMEPCEIVPEWGETWPYCREINGSVTIEFVAGFGAASAVPETYKQAMLLLISHWFENREAVVVGTISKEVELSLNAILSLHAVENEFGYESDD